MNIHSHVHGCHTSSNVCFQLHCVHGFEKIKQGKWNATAELFLCHLKEMAPEVLTDFGSLLLSKELLLLAPLILGDKAELFLPGEAPEGHGSDCSLSVQNRFCKCCQRLFYRELFHALPASGLMFLSPDGWIVAEKPLLRIVAFQGDVAALCFCLLDCFLWVHLPVKQSSDDIQDPSSCAYGCSLWCVMVAPSEENLVPLLVWFEFAEMGFISRRIEKCFLFGLPLEQAWRTWF